MHHIRSALILSAALVLGACSNGVAKYPTGFDRSETNGDIYGKRQSVFGDHGFCLGGSQTRNYMSESAPSVFAKAKISLATAIKNAEAATKGRAFDAEINPDTNEAYYIVKLEKRGKVITVPVSAKTGQVLEWQK